MRIFVTGATGYIGSALVQELREAGYEVLGLSRGDESAAKLEQMGAEAHRGDLSDMNSLAEGARSCDGVIHTAFVHDFSHYQENIDLDRRAIETMGEALASSDRPLVVISGTAGVSPGRVLTEEDKGDPNSAAAPRLASEKATVALVEKRIRAIIVRLPPSVHGDGDKGFVPAVIGTAREKKVSVYIGDGQNRWPAVHRLDAAHLLRLALEKGKAGYRYHGVADEGIAFRDIATVIGKRLAVTVVSRPSEEASSHFGFLGAVIAMDIPASSRKTRDELGWSPTQPDLISDLDRPEYFS